MSNIRPWFRLSSIARPTSQGSSDPPPPPPRQTPRRTVVVRPPPAKQPSPPRQQQPPSPPRQQQQRLPSPPRQQSPPPRQQQQQPPPPPRQQTPPPPPPKERSPYHSPLSHHMSPPSRHMSPQTPPKTATQSPPPPQPQRSSYTPPPSPKEVQEALPPRKPISPPSPMHSTRLVRSESDDLRKTPSSHKVIFSPYSLPPAQLHSERETTQKNILTAEKTNQPHEPNHQNHNQNHNQNHQGNNHTKKTNQQPHAFDSENIMGTRVITIAGENKGAVMEIIRSPSSNKTGGTGTHSSRVFNGGGEKGRKLQSSSSSSSSDEGKGKKKTTKSPNNNGNHANIPMKAFMNSNVQMINNSIVYNSSASHHDPGVHLRIFRKPGSSNDFHVKEYGNNGGYSS